MSTAIEKYNAELKDRQDRVLSASQAYHAAMFEWQNAAFSLEDHQRLGTGRFTDDEPVSKPSSFDGPPRPSSPPDHTPVA